MEMELNNAGGDPNRLQVNQGESYDLEILLRRPSLRANVSRKSSQVQPITIKTRETTCGIACLRGDWLQSFSTRTSFLVIYGALACFYGSSVTYFYGSITTLEKTFRLTSQSIGIITSISDFVQVIMCLLLSLCNVKSQRPRWIGLGIFLIFSSSLIWSSTHFLFENVNLSNIEHDNSSELISPKVPEGDRVLQEKLLIICLYLAQFLHGIGGSLFFVLGTAYIEDNTTDFQTPSMLNLLLALKTIGLSLGYWLSSLCLKIFTSRAHDPDIAEGSPKWIGAWWFGNLMVAFLIVIPGFIISLYPSSMPKRIVRRMLNIISNSGETNESNKGTNKNILTSALHYKNFSGIYNVFRFSVYFIFLTKYVEIQYNITASRANFTVGTITLLCSAFGTVLAGSLVSRYKPGIICLIIWNFTTGILSIGCLIYYIFLGCPDHETQTKSLILQFAALSSDPKLNTSEIAYPDSVCDEFGETYLSIQMIGCSNTLKHNQTILCNSINRNFTGYSKMKTLHEGPCSVDCQSEFLKFIFTTCVMSFIYGSGKISNFLVHMKDNYEGGKSRLLNWGLFLNLLTFIPVPLLFGHFLDISCIFWDDNKSQTGNCWLYDTEYLRLLFNVSAVAFATVGIISDTLVLLSLRDVKMNYNEIY